MAPIRVRRRFLLTCAFVILVFYLLSRRPKSPPPIITPVYPPLPPDPALQSDLRTFGFTRGISVFQPDGLSKHLVVPVSPHENTSFLEHLPSWLNLQPVIYYHPSDPRVAAAAEPKPLTIPRNKGNEVMTYLTYILDHYNALPDVIIFVHPHPAAWHNNDIHLDTTALMLREFNYRRVVRNGYMNLRCHWMPGCPAWIKPNSGVWDDRKGEEWYFRDVYRALFPGVKKMPAVFAGPCCAQFAVAREAVLRHGVNEYMRWRNWLMDAKLTDRLSGRVWEYLWQYIFAGKEVLCPVEEVCYCDGYGVCFETADYWDHMRRRQELSTLKKSLRTAVEEGLRPGEDPKFKEMGVKNLAVKIEEIEEGLEEDVRAARERGRDPEVRRRLVGNREFSG